MRAFRPIAIRPIAIRAIAIRAIASALLLSGAPALAEATSRQISTSGKWEVEAVNWDDGTSACVAQTGSDVPQTMSIWADTKNPLRLQFFSPGWNLGDHTEDVSVTIDANAAWQLNDANFYKQSILFDLPKGEGSDRFMAELKGGKSLVLRDEDGSVIGTYDLAGAAESVARLDPCLAALK